MVYLLKRGQSGSILFALAFPRGERGGLLPVYWLVSKPSLSRSSLGSICSPTLQEKQKLEEAEDVLSSLEHDTNPETVPRQWIFWENL